MNRSSIALFLTTLALAGGTVSCGQKPEAGKDGGSETKELRTPEQPASPSSKGDEQESQKGDEGGEGGEG